MKLYNIPWSVLQWLFTPMKQLDIQLCLLQSLRVLAYFCNLLDILALLIWTKKLRCLNAVDIFSQCQYSNPGVCVWDILFTDFLLDTPP